MDNKPCQLELRDFPVFFGNGMRDATWCNTYPNNMVNVVLWDFCEFRFCTHLLYQDLWAFSFMRHLDWTLQFTKFTIWTHWDPREILYIWFDLLNLTFGKFCESYHSLSMFIPCYDIYLWCLCHYRICLWLLAEWTHSAVARHRLRPRITRRQSPYLMTGVCHQKIWRFPIQGGGTPKSSVLMRFSIINHLFGWSPIYLWKAPYSIKINELNEIHLLLDWVFI